ncbi:hypothetical protein G7Y89_g5928 [Cudoniella acicularis]|uniref:Chromo domain-containing protein n=1 Tax=Cudoniella acicularis TaxID=354080 RepID=A0A8H4RLJ6_9HELO|nr:hypothetical protein G7Y89_g5928 [Cudoniella acicularis]
MDQAVGKRVDSITRKIKSQPRHSTPRKRKQLRTSTPKPKEKEYPIKDIREEERRSDGKTWYLIDWEDDSTTGESYPESWEPAENVTEKAIRDWEKEKRRREREREGGGRAAGTAEESSSLFIPPEDSQPIRTAKRKRPSKPIEDSPESELETKKARRAGTAETARFQSVLQESLDSEAGPSEIKDSYEEELQSSAGKGVEARVEIPALPKDFNPGDYPLVQSSQLSQTTEDTGNYSISTSSQAVTQSQPQFKTPAKRTIFWEDDIEGVIPDSQDVGGSSPYLPSDIPTSTAPEDTEVDQTSSLQPASILESHIAEPFIAPESISYFPTSSHPEDSEPVAIPESATQGHSSNQPPKDTEQLPEDSELVTILESATQENSSDQLPEDSEPVAVPESATQENSSDQLPKHTEQLSEELQEQASGTSLSSLLNPLLSQAPQPSPGIQSVENSDSPPFGPRATSTELPETSSVPCEQEAQPEHSEFPSSVPFQTQTKLPYPQNEDSVPRPEIRESAIKSCDQSQTLSLNKDSLLPVPSHTQILEPESHEHQLSLASQRSVSGFKPTWQAAGALSATPRPNTQIHSGRRESDSQVLYTQQSPPQASPPRRSSSRASPFQYAPVNSSPLQPLPLQPSPFRNSPLRPSPLKDTSSLEKAASTIDEPRFVSAPKQIASQLSTPVRTPEENSRPPSAEISPSLFSRSILPSVEGPIGTLSSPKSLIFSDSEMEESSGPNNPIMDTKALLKQARANASAKRAAERAAARSASTMPATPPPPPPGQMLPLRETITEIAIPLPVIAPPSPAKQSSGSEPEPATKILNVLPLASNEYVLPLPLVSHTRDLYVQTLKNKKNQRLALLEDDVDESLLSEIDAMIDELEKTCEHPDLNDDDFSTQRAEPFERQARYAENISTKCMFLSDLIGHLRNSDKHVIVACRPGRMQEILASILLHHGFALNDNQNTYYDTSKAGMSIRLLPCQKVEDNDIGKGGGPIDDNVTVFRPSIAIAFDSLGYKSYIKSLPSYPRENPIPLVSLVVTHSIEHLNLCLEENMNIAERRVTLVSCLSQIGDGVGKLSSDHASPSNAAEAVASFVVGETDGQWPLLQLDEIDGIDFDVSPGASQASQTSQAELTNINPSDSTTQSYDLSQHADVAQSNNKRPLDVETATSSDSPKRQRLSPLPGEQAENPNDSHVSDTVMHTSSGEKEFATAGTAESMFKNEAQQLESSFSKRIRDLEQDIAKREVAEAELRQRNESLEARCKDLESSIREIQPKFQEALNDQGKETAEEELKAVRIQLSSSTVPEIAEFNKIADELRAENTVKERLEKRILSIQNEVEFLRNQYQTTSSAAAEKSKQLERVQEELEKAQEKADENKVRIHEIYNSSEVQQHLDRIKDMTAENEELERELEKKSEEVRALMNGRRQTRGASVPRSPRMGQGTMSPNARPMGRVMSNRSRGNSPAPGDVPVRGQFSEALFQAPPGSGRWGNHLV